TAEKACDFTANREAEPGSAELAAGRPIALLERLEHHPLAVDGDTDAGVDDRERDHLIGLVERCLVASPALLRGNDPKRHAALLGELHGVGEQVPEYLLQPLRVGVDGWRERGVQLNSEVESLLLRDLAEVALHIVPQLVERGIDRMDLH